MTDSTDPGAVTHEHTNALECECCQCMLRSVRAGWRSGGKRIGELEAQLAEVTRDRDDHVDACADVAAQRDEISAQLTAMTARAEAAEADASDAWQSFEKEKSSRVAAEAELAHMREAAELLRWCENHDSMGNRFFDLQFIHKAMVAWYERDQARQKDSSGGARVAEQTHAGSPGGDPDDLALHTRECNERYLSVVGGRYRGSPRAGSGCCVQAGASTSSAGSGGEVSAGDPPPEPALDFFDDAWLLARYIGDHYDWKPNYSDVKAAASRILAGPTPGERRAPQPAAAPKVLPVAEAIARERVAAGDYVHAQLGDAAEETADDIRRGAHMGEDQGESGEAYPPPKVLPMDELNNAGKRLEAFRIFGNGEDLMMAVANVIEYLRLSDRLERGGEKR